MNSLKQPLAPERAGPWCHWQPGALKQSLHAFSQREVGGTVHDVVHTMRELIAAGFADLPAPGQGNTLLRWQVLAEVAAADLSLLKLFEAHTDAHAILTELRARTVPDGLWAVWAAEPPQARVEIVAHDADQVTLKGRKAWCSGAADADHAVMTVWNAQGQSQLVAVTMDQPGVRVTQDGWQAVGMASAASFEIVFDGVSARCIGGPGDYVERPGFWQGAAGIAACWYGAGVALAAYLHQHGRDQPHARAHLGAVDAALGCARQALCDCARWIDAHPDHDAEYHARRTRAQVEAAMDEIIHHVGRALGAAPFCRNPHFARLMADLPVFLRQSHAERDLQRLGDLAQARSVEEWSL